MLNKEKQRIAYIDQAKGLGILLIVLGHISYSYGSFSNFASYFKISIFYVVSGCLFSLHLQDKSIDMKKKLESLIFPYFFWSLIFMVIEMVRAFFRGFDSERIGRDIVDIFTGRGVLTLWFLPSLLVAVAAHKYSVKWKVWYRIILLIIIPVIAIMVSSLPFITEPVEGLSVIYVLYCFALVGLKGIVAYWFLEISFLLLNKLMEAKIPRITPFLTIMLGYCVTVNSGACHCVHSVNNCSQCNHMISA